jgi:hypothetical protein
MPEGQVINHYGMSNHSRTFLLDLDGTLIRHQAPPWAEPMEVLPGVIEKLREWWNSGDCIVIATGRPECLRAMTELGLQRAGIYYHQLIMGLTSGTRYLVNDMKPSAENHCTAFALNVKRNEGLSHEDFSVLIR